MEARVGCWISSSIVLLCSPLREVFLLIWKLAFSFLPPFPPLSLSAPPPFLSRMADWQSLMLHHLQCWGYRHKQLHPTFTCWRFQLGSLHLQIKVLSTEQSSQNWMILLNVVIDLLLLYVAKTFPNFALLYKPAIDVCVCISTVAWWLHLNKVWTINGCS